MSEPYPFEAMFNRFTSGLASIDLKGGSLTALRETIEGSIRLVCTQGPDMMAVGTEAAPGPARPVPVRHYTPYAGGVEPAPGLVFFHGGGFVTSSLDTHDALCRTLAARARVRVVSVDYRLAPEHPFPAAYEDALAAYDWIAGEGADLLGLDPTRIAVAGDSAGGNLAAGVARARREGERAPVFQLLIYPWLQLVETNTSRLKLEEGHLVAAGILEVTRRAYLAGTDPNDVRISPILANDLAGLPPACIITAGLDPLRVEGAAYADKLSAAGVPAQLIHIDGAPHGFATQTRIVPKADAAITEMAEALAKGLERA